MQDSTAETFLSLLSQMLGDMPNTAARERLAARFADEPADDLPRPHRKAPLSDRLRALHSAARTIAEEGEDQELLAVISYAAGWSLQITGGSAEQVLKYALEADKHAEQAAPYMLEELARLRGEALYDLERWAEACTAYRAASTNDDLTPRSRAELLGRWAEACMAAGDEASARARVEELLAQIPTVGDLESEMTAHLQIGKLAAAWGDDARAVEQLSRFLEMAPDRPEHEPGVATARIWLGRFAWEAGDMRTALDHLRRAAILLRRGEAPAGWRAWGLSLLGTVLQENNEQLWAARVLWDAARAYGEAGRPLLAVSCLAVAWRGLWFTAQVRRLPAWLWHPLGRSASIGPTRAGWGCFGVAFLLLGLTMGGLSYALFGVIWPAWVSLFAGYLLLLGTGKLERVFFAEL